MTDGPCEPWFAADAAGCDGVTDTDVLVASDLMYVLSGRRYPGVCEVTLRPVLCRCLSPGGCSCRGVPSVRLVADVVEVVEVRVDGALLPQAGEWEVIDGMDLLRLAGPDGRRRWWPTCQRVDVPATEPGTFEVVLRAGRVPPPSGVEAAKVLACEFVKARTASVSCRLPRRVQTVTRQNVTLAMLDPMEFLENGRTGIPEVDLFLTAHNPDNDRGGAVVLSPDLPRHHRFT